MEFTSAYDGVEADRSNFKTKSEKALNEVIENVILLFTKIYIMRWKKSIMWIFHVDIFFGYSHKA